MAKKRSAQLDDSDPPLPRSGHAVAFPVDNVSGPPWSEPRAVDPEVAEAITSTTFKVLPRSRPHEDDKERADREERQEREFAYRKDEGTLRRR
jgi:hypothetical protein